MADHTCKHNARVKISVLISLSRRLDRCAHASQDFFFSVKALCVFCWLSRKRWCYALPLCLQVTIDLVRKYNLLREKSVKRIELHELGVEVYEVDEVVHCIEAIETFVLGMIAISKHPQFDHEDHFGRSGIRRGQKSAADLTAQLNDIQNELKVCSICCFFARVGTCCVYGQRVESYVLLLNVKRF